VGKWGPLHKGRGRGVRGTGRRWQKKSLGKGAKKGEGSRSNPSRGNQKRKKCPSAADEQDPVAAGSQGKKARPREAESEMWTLGGPGGEA